MSEWDTDARWCDVRASVDTLPSAGQTLQLRSREIAFSQTHDDPHYPGIQPSNQGTTTAGAR